MKPQHDLDARRPHPLQSRRPVINFVDDSARVPASAAVWHFAIVLADVTLGIGVSIGSRAEIGRGTTIGDHSRIGSGVFLPSNSRIGQYVFIGPNVTFTDDKYPRVPVPGDPPYVAEPPVIEDGASIGAGAVICPGVRIGANARIAAGAIVTKHVGANEIVKGEPARPHEGSTQAKRAGWVPVTTPQARAVDAHAK